MKHNLEVQQLVIWFFGNICAEQDVKFKVFIQTQSCCFEYLQNFILERWVNEELSSIVVYLISNVLGVRKFNRILSKAEKHEVNQEIHDMLSEDQFSMLMKCLCNLHDKTCELENLVEEQKENSQNDARPIFDTLRILVYICKIDLTGNLILFIADNFCYAQILRSSLRLAVSTDCPPEGDYGDETLFELNNSILN